MKKITLLFIGLFIFGGIITAQSDKEEMDLMQAAFGMEKKSMVSECVKVDATQKDVFWKLYDEYETQRKTLGVRRVELLKKYAANYDKLTIEFADSWSKEVLDLTKKTDALMVTYFNKIKKATNSVVALQFYQVESYILAGIRLSVLEELPFPDLKK